MFQSKSLLRPLLKVLSTNVPENLRKLVSPISDSLLPFPTFQDAPTESPSHSAFFHPSHHCSHSSQAGQFPSDLFIRRYLSLSWRTDVIKNYRAIKPCLLLLSRVIKSCDKCLAQGFTFGPLVLVYVQIYKHKI